MVAQDNVSYTHWPPLGLMYLGALLRARYDVLIWNQQSTHMAASALGGAIRDSAAPDAVLMSWTAGPVPHRMALELAAQVPAYVPIVAGGHGPSGGASWYREHLRAEGTVEVVEGLGRSEVLDVSADVDIDTPLGAVLEGWPVDYYAMLRAPRCEATDRVWPVMTARGCPHRCTFCYRLEPGYVTRDLEAVARDVDYLHAEHGITYVQLYDESALASPGRALALCEMMRGRGLRWSTQGTVTALARGGAMLARSLADAGCVFVNVGVESMSVDALRRMGKHHAPEQAEAALRYLREAGVSPGINIIWPMPGDTTQSLAAAVALIHEHTDGAQLRTIRPPTPWPGCALWHDAVEAGVYRDVGDFYWRYRCSDVASMPVEGMGLHVIDGMLRVANKRLLTEYHTKRLQDDLRQCIALYDGDAAGFRGWRQT